MQLVNIPIFSNAKLYLGQAPGSSYVNSLPPQGYTLDYNSYNSYYDPQAEADAAIAEIEELKGKVDVVVVLQSASEIGWSNPDLFDMYYDSRIRVMHYPIQDMGVPKSLESLDRLVNGILTLLGNRRNVLVHCFGGKGRTGLVAAAVLIRSKKANAKQAIAYVRRIRPGSIETPQQEVFLLRYDRMVNDAEASRRH